MNSCSSRATTFVRTDIAMVRTVTPQWVYRTRRVTAAWMVVLWLALFSVTTYAQCCHEGPVRTHGHESAAGHSHSSESGQNHQDEPRAGSCPEWQTVLALSAKPLGIGSSTDGHVVILPTSYQVIASEWADVSLLRLYFAALPPPRTYIRFCRFRE